MIALVLAALAVAQDGVADPTAPAPTAAGPDRSRAPDVRPASLLDLPAPTTATIAEGVVLKHVRVPGVRKVHVAIYQHRGGFDLDGYVSPVQLATGWLLDTAGGERSASDVAIYEDLWDVDVWSETGGLLRQATHLEVPAEDLERGAELFAELFRTPSYPGADVKQWRIEQVRSLTEEDPTSPASVASAARTFAWFPESSPYGRRPDLDALGSVKAKALRARHAALRGAPITVVSVGDVEIGAIEAMIRDVLGEGDDGAAFGGPGQETPPPEFVPPTASRIVAVDVDSEQATLSLRLAAPLRDDPERVAFEGVAWAYGGHFMSRINKNLREERGLTYGAGARYDAGRAIGTFGVGVDVPADKVSEAMTQIEAEIQGIVAAGVTPGELSAWSIEEVGYWNQVLGTTDSAFDFYASLIVDQEDVADVRARIERSRAVTTADTVAAARWLAPDRPRTWVVVGPRAVIEAQLPAGLPVTWVTPEDAILGNL
jgi:zinc protease